MPELRKLTKDEVDALKKKVVKEKGQSQRKLVRQEYRQYLEQYKPGDWVEVTLAEGEKRQTVKGRFLRAADELGLVLNFKRTKGNIIRFEVAKAEEK